MQQSGELKHVPEGGKAIYRYIWKLGGKDLEYLENVVVFSGQTKLATNVINFDSGILKDTEHAMQFFVLLADGPQLFAKILMKPPAMIKGFTHSKIEIVDLSGLLESSWRVFTKVSKATLPQCFAAEDLQGGNNVTWWKSRKIGFTKGIKEITFRLNMTYAYWCSFGIETVPCIVTPHKSSKRKPSAPSEKDAREKPLENITNNFQDKIGEGPVTSAQVQVGRKSIRQPKLKANGDISRIPPELGYTAANCTTALFQCNINDSSILQ